MGAKLTFLHSADLHLGAPFRGVRSLSPAWADRLIESIPESYGRLIDAAIKNEVDFAVFAGDIFDTARPSFADYMTFFDGVRRLGKAGIPVYLCTGNHDPYTSWERDFASLPDNATMFTAPDPSFHLFERDGEPLCILGGRGYYNQTWPADVCIADGLTRADAERALGERAARAPFSIGIIHSGTSFDKRNAPVELSRLMAAGFDYWACGHLHAKMLIPEEDPRIGYPGCIQGRDILEEGERGAYIVTLEQGRATEARFVPTASVVWQRVTVDVEDCANIAEITDKILRELFRLNGAARCEEMCVRITMAGATPLHGLLGRPGVIEDMRKTINTSYAEFFCDALLDDPSERMDIDALRREGLFPSVLLQVADAMRADPDGQAAFVQAAFIERGLTPQAYPDDPASVVDHAQRLVLDMLAKEDERA